MAKLIMLYFRRLLHSLFFISLCLATTIVAADDDSQFIKFSRQNLIDGRFIWIENCKGCHAYGTADAPVPMIAAQWKDRVIKDTAVLYDHAINGFFGPEDTMMPERGGNPELSDQEVRLAVDYMLALAQHYIEQADK